MSPAAMSPDAELEAAIAALSAKKDALREAFDRLASSSPTPLPFCWEDLDSYISSLHSSFSFRFRQLQVLKDCRPIPAVLPPVKALVDGNTKNPDEEKEGEEATVEDDRGWELMEEEADEGLNNKSNWEEDVVMEVEEADGEAQDAGYEMGKKSNKEALNEEEPVELDDEADKEMLDNHDELGNKSEESGGIIEGSDSDKIGKKTHYVGKIGAAEELATAHEDVVMEVEEVDGETQDDGCEMGKKSSTEVVVVEEPMKLDDEADKEMLDTHDELGNKIEEDGVIMEGNDKVGNKTHCASKIDATEDLATAREEPPDVKYANNASNDQEIEKAKEKGQDVNMEDVVAKKLSMPQNKDEAVCGDEKEKVHEAIEEVQDAEAAMKVYQMQDKEGELAGAKNMSQEQGDSALPGSANSGHTSMNNRWLVKSVSNCIILGQALPIGIRCHPDAAALTLRVVKLFLHNKKPKTKEAWGTCVALFKSVSEAAAKPSADVMEQAKQMAKDWKEMIGNPESSMVLGNLASWGFLYFLICYNIVSEFDADEIIRLFGTVPRKKQKKNTIKLLKDLGLADRITDLIDYLIGNGQLLDGLNLTHAFKLVDKYPPLSVLKGYVEKAKQTAIEILGKKMTYKSQDAVIEKEVKNLRDAHNLVQKYITDSGQFSTIAGEIVNLLHEYGKKKKSSANSNTTSTSNKQQQQKQSNEKRKKEDLEQEHCEGQQEQRQVRKPGEKLQKKQNGPQQKRETDDKEKKPQKNHQGRAKGPKRSKQAARWVPYMERIGHFGHTGYAGIHGVHGHPSQPCWPEVPGAPFAPHLGVPQYMEPYDPFYPHPQFYFG